MKHLLIVLRPLLRKIKTAFDYIGKILIVLSKTTGGVSIISFTSIAGAPVGIA